MAGRNVVTLDLWRTLIVENAFVSPSGVSRNAARLAGVSRALADAGRKVSDDALEGALERVRIDIDHAHFNGVDRTFPLWVRQVVEYAAPGSFDALPEETASAVIDALDAPFLEAPPKPHEAATEVLESLKDAGLRLALISNTGFTSGDMYRQWFEQLGWLGHFEVTTFSNDVSMAKPTAGMFIDTLNQMGASVDQAIHVGDSLHSDIEGAEAVGMSSAWISGFDDSESNTTPTYTLSDLSELPAAVGEWRNG